ncbi:uncharacterized protein Dwil_GK13192 [Drosophila willistoni]|uniref:Uncharacterized protein n=1 Tax=Drosophila willistoni TaxID=7260 RepID=B4NLF3_DROWI|nr:uncharacterized protein LOC6650750 [Drosophila willistoni]EDW84356.1 uncharacterized protein Dwil_GK13192 [Drosophila willistoni]
MLAHSSAGFLDYNYPQLALEFFKQVATPDGYRFNLEEPNGSKREEIGLILNPGTDKEEHVRMGTYSSYDEKTDTESITMYTADKNGYKARYEVKNRKLSNAVLKSATFNG